VADGPGLQACRGNRRRGWQAGLAAQGRVLGAHGVVPALQLASDRDDGQVRPRRPGGVRCPPPQALAVKDATAMDPMSDVGPVPVMQAGSRIELVISGPARLR
jgi:hypothetical protein